MRVGEAIEMSESRIIVWFSCGSASAFAGKKTIELFPEREVLIVCCDTRPSEHPDNYRFSQEVEQWLGRKIIYIRNSDYDYVDGSFQIETDAPEEYRGLYLTRWRCPFTSKSNNEAEYLTLWLAIHEVIAKFPQTTYLQIFSDSALVVNQIRGEWKCRDSRMTALRNKCLSLIETLPLSKWFINWVPRQEMVARFQH